MKSDKINIKMMVAFIMNLFIVMLEIAGVFLSVEKYGVGVFRFYTENSNYFSLIVSFIFCVAYLVCCSKEKELPRWVHNLRYISTICLTVTLIVVGAVLLPMDGSVLNEMFFRNSNLYHHLLCPVLSILSFVLFENENLLNKNMVWLSLIPTIIYGVICLLLNIARLLDGPYPFFFVYEFDTGLLILWLSGILIGVFMVCLVYYLIRNTIVKNMSKTK